MVDTGPLGGLGGLDDGLKPIVSIVFCWTLATYRRRAANAVSAARGAALILNTVWLVRPSAWAMIERLGAVLGARQSA
jgi:hypothetical protein